MDYLYDGSFEGLLCCVYAHYYIEKAEGIFERQIYQQNMLRGSRSVETDGRKAARVYDAIKSKISPGALRRVYAVYLSCEPEKEMKILRYVALGFRVGGRVELMHGDPVVFEAQQAERRVHAERHRYAGILRFSVISHGDSSGGAGRAGPADAGEREILYAELEPDHDIIELMAPHFSDRYKNDPFIIHDIKREKAVFAQRGHWYLSFLPKDAHITLAPGEREYRKLWKRYFEQIAVKERINPRCQKQYMPVRYWKYLTEMQRD